MRKSTRNKSDAQNYTASSIKVTKDLEHVRLRPTTHLGDQPRDTGMREIIDNAFDEISGGYADRVSVIIHGENDFEVIDNGRGVPFDWNDEESKNGIVLALGTKEAGQNFENSSEELGSRRGTNGVGGSATNGVSKRFDVTVRRDGKQYEQDFCEGVPGHFKGSNFDPYADFTPQRGEKLKGKKDTSGLPTGTSIRWSFDEDLLDGYELHLDEVLWRAQCTAYLTPYSHLDITLEDDRRIEVTAPEENGTVPLMKFITGEESNPIFTLSGETEYELRKNTTRKVAWEISGILNNDERGRSWGFTNGIYNKDGGSHITGVTNAITQLISSRLSSIKSIKKEDADIVKPENIMNSIDLIVSIHGSDIDQKGQEKAAVSNIKLGNAVKASVNDEFTTWMSARKNQSALTSWAKLSVTNAKASISAEKAKERLRDKQQEKRVGKQVLMPSKLVACNNTGRGSGAELFICEGESALGTLLKARNPQSQALFPIRGKIINALKATVDKSLSNAEVNGILKASDSINDKGKNDSSLSEYDKYILTADADHDGSHILLLLLTIFYKLTPDIIENNMVYIAHPPLYRVMIKGEPHYANTDRELEDIRKKYNNGRQFSEGSIERFKGLGQMEEEDFRITVMDSDTRKLTQVTLESAEMAAQSFEKFMGKDVAHRKEYIQSQSWN